MQQATPTNMASAPAAPALPPATPLLIAACFGMLTGYGEVVILYAQKFLLQHFIFFSPHIVWMAPLANLGFFLLGGLLLWGGQCYWPRLVSWRLTVWAMTFLSFLSLLLLYPGLHRQAMLILAAGLAVQATRTLTVHSHGFLLCLRRTVAWLMVSIVILAGGFLGWPWWREYRAVAQLPPAPSTAPNVVLLVLDTVRAKNLSVYGYPRPTTPHLEQWAKTGVRFEQAMSTAPWTTPAHASLFTGRWPHELTTATGGFHNAYPVMHRLSPTLAEVLSQHGYVTAGFVANMEYCGYETGLSRGFLHYDDYPLTLEEFVLSASLGRTLTKYQRLRHWLGYYDIFSRKTAAEVNHDFLRWLKKQKQRPFFAFLNYYDAHEPYLPPSPFAEQLAATTPRQHSLIVQLPHRQAERHDKHEMSPAEIDSEMFAYDGAIAYMDHHIGILLRELAQQALLDNTLIILTSDHGEQFGEHGLFKHSNSLYLPLLHVPLLMAFPKHIPVGLNVSTPVSIRDIPATVLDLLGLKNTNTPTFPGNSLAQYWNGPPTNITSYDAPVFAEVDFLSRVPRWYPVSRGDLQALIVDTHHYIKNGDGSEELYNFDSDPLEQHNLVGMATTHAVLEQFRHSLATVLRRSTP